MPMDKLMSKSCPPSRSVKRIPNAYSASRLVKILQVNATIIWTVQMYFTVFNFCMVGDYMASSYCFMVWKSNKKTTST